MKLKQTDLMTSFNKFTEKYSLRVSLDLELNSTSKKIIYLFVNEKLFSDYSKFINYKEKDESKFAEICRVKITLYTYDIIDFLKEQGLI